MQESEPYSQHGSVHPILKATLHMDEAFEGFRRDLIQPFAEPATSDEHWTVWHAHELRCRPQWEDAIEYWLANCVRPPLDDGTAYFLCRRFDQVSEFLKNLFVQDLTTVFAHPGLSLNEFLRWMLLDWWESHGIREAYFEDLERYEHRYESDG
jgi:hypothetical protein